MIRERLERVHDLRQRKLSLSQSRSPQWPKVRAKFLKEFPTCQVCDGIKKLQVHHIRPVHVWPELELSPANLITLCEASGNHHLWTGHLGSFQSWNIDVINDAANWHTKITERPYA